MFAGILDFTHVPAGKRGPYAIISLNVENHISHDPNVLPLTKLSEFLISSLSFTTMKNSRVKLCYIQFTNHDFYDDLYDL